MTTHIDDAANGGSEPGAWMRAMDPDAPLSATFTEGETTMTPEQQIRLAALDRALQALGESASYSPSAELIALAKAFEGYLRG